MQLQALLACGNWADLTGVSIVPILLALARGSVHLLAVMSGVTEGWEGPVEVDEKE